VQGAARNACRSEYCKHIGCLRSRDQYTDKVDRLLEARNTLQQQDIVIHRPEPAEWLVEPLRMKHEEAALRTQVFILGSRDSEDAERAVSCGFKYPIDLAMEVIYRPDRDVGAADSSAGRAAKYAAVCAL